MMIFCTGCSWSQQGIILARCLPFPVLLYLVHSFVIFCCLLSLPTLYSIVTRNLAIVYFYRIFSDTYFQIGDFVLLYFIAFSISIRKCCCGPKIDPGLAMRIHPIKSGALKQ